MSNTLASKKKTIRVFFAIKPDDAAIKQLTRLAKQLTSFCSGQYTKNTNIHLTLVFLGEIANSQLNLLRSAANSITAQEFNFSVDEIRYWRHNRIFYGGTNKCAPELLNLVNNLKDTLSANGFAYDTRTYKPHITLVRKAKPIQVLPPLTTPIRWRVTEWFLIQSKQIDHRINYISLGRWPLRHSSSQTLLV